MSEQNPMKPGHRARKKQEPTTRTLAVRLPLEMVAKVEAQAEKEHRTPTSVFLRHVILDYFERIERGGK